MSVPLQKDDNDSDVVQAAHLQCLHHQSIGSVLCQLVIRLLLASTAWLALNGSLRISTLQSITMGFPHFIYMVRQPLIPMRQYVLFAQSDEHMIIQCCAKSHIWQTMYFDQEQSGRSLCIPVLGSMACTCTLMLRTVQDST